MIYDVLAVYDKKAKAFFPPFFSSNVAVGVRMVASAVNDPTHQLSKYSADFSVYHLGMFNDEHAEFTLFPEKVVYAECVQLKAEVQRV